MENPSVPRVPAFAPPLLCLVGLFSLVFSATQLYRSPLDWRLIPITIVTVFLSSQLSIRIPYTELHYSLSDILIFLIFFSYGGYVAAILAALESLYATFRLRNKPVPENSAAARARWLWVIVTNVSATTSVILVMTLVVRWVSGTSETELAQLGRHLYLLNLGQVMLVHFILNCFICSIFVPRTAEQSIWTVWRSVSSYTGILSFIAAFGAGFIRKLFGVFDITQLLSLTIFAYLIYVTVNYYINQILTAEKERMTIADQKIQAQKESIAELEAMQTELTASREKFRHAALHDTLTGLPNRAFLVESIRQAISRQRSGDDGNFALLYFDLNRFKNINDSMGHLTGDELLIQIAERLRCVVRNQDVVTRLGGDEFAILLENVPDANTVVVLAERIQDTFTKPFQIDYHELFTSASIGIALGSDKYSDPEGLLRDADTAMYHAKESGTDSSNGTYCLFNQSMHEQVAKKLKVENDLRRAIDRREFVMHYQPIVELRTKQLYGFEALIRWQHPERGLVPPFEFISIAEDTGLIIDITSQTLIDACMQLRSWQLLSPSYAHLVMSVNISAKHFGQASLVYLVRDAIELSGIAASTLKLELTESAVMNDPKTAVANLHALKELGVQLSLDDFGTGYSSLSCLAHFPIDILKIDRSFVMKMQASSQDLEIVRTVITLAHNFHMKVVAEGIEQPEELAILEVLGCEYGQGYHISRPQAPLVIQSKLDEFPVAPQGASSNFLASL